MAYEKVLNALSVPTRRAILEALRGRAMSVRELASVLPVSQPAVSQHLRTLEKAGLVEMRREGTRHVYRVRPGGVDSLREYLDRFWGDVLDAFADPERK